MDARRLPFALVALGAFICLPGAALAGQTGKTPSQPAAAAPAKAADKKPEMPDVNKMTLLIQVHMAALAQAIVTENYSVLRAMGAPAFQENNSADKLKATFGTFKAQGIDLSPVILFKPILVQPPAIDDRGMLRLTGHYLTEPQNVQFDMLFESVKGSWRLFGISANVPAAQQGAAAVPSPAQ